MKDSEREFAQSKYLLKFPKKFGLWLVCLEMHIIKRRPSQSKE